MGKEGGEGHYSSKEEGHDDEPNNVILEGGECLGEGQGLCED